MDNNPGLLTFYSDIQPQKVNWLWYPYLPFGKISLIQGDPGDGKSTMMMNIIAEISIGGKLPDGTGIDHPRRIIYQCSEDGARDTIRPRLENCGANCKIIAFIDEEIHTGLTLDDDRLRDTIAELRPKLVVIDPIQSYIESDSDLRMAAKARKLMRRIGTWASTYWDSDGYILLYQRLESGQYQWPRNESNLKELTAQQFRWLMSTKTTDNGNIFI